SLRYIHLSLNFRHELQRRDRSDLPIHQKRSFYDHDLWSLPTLHVYVFQFLYGLSTRLELKYRGSSETSAAAQGGTANFSESLASSISASTNPELSPWNLSISQRCPSNSSR